MVNYLRGPEPRGAINTGAELRILTKNKDGVDFSLIFYPDINNDLLRQAGKPMHFYYIPDRVVLAKEMRGGKNRLKFHMQEFAGILTKDGNVATAKDFEIAGGYLTFSTTMAYDEEAIAKITDNLQAELEKSYRNSHLMGWNRSLPRVKIGPVQIVKSTTVIDKMDLNVNFDDTVGPQPGSFVVQGEGDANISPTGTNAYSVMLGALPVQMVKAAAKSGESSLVVRNHVAYKIHTPKFKLSIKGNWKSIYEHFSMSFKGHAFFVSADVAAEWNNLVKSGVVQVSMEIDKEFVDGAMEDKLNQHKDAIIKVFMDQASKAILEPAAPKVEPAKAEDKGGWFWGGGAAFKFRNDRSTLDLQFEEEVNVTVLKTTVISANLQGLYDEIKKDAAAEKLYFSTVYLDEGFQKIHIIGSCNAHFTDNGVKGDPIERIDLEVGYPDSQGKLVWKASGKYKDNNADPDLSTDSAPAFWDESTQNRLYVFDFLKQKNLNKDQVNKIYVRKNIRFKARPNVLVKTVKIEEITEDRIVEVRGESAGKFGVKISLDNVPLPPKTKVIVTCHVDGLPDEMFEFNAVNTVEEAPVYNWEIYYAKAEDIKPWKYKVDVAIAGPKFSQKTLKWGSGWLDGEARGRNVLLNASVPEPPAEISDKVEEYLSVLMG